jgi:hypothetical protein
MEDKLCILNQCKHFGKDDHKNGSCWVVTEGEKEGPLETNGKTSEIYCKCDSQHGHNLRSYQDLGYMEPESADMMIRKRCIRCRVEKLLRRDEVYCSDCRPYDTPKLDKIPEFLIFHPLSQSELQAIL